MSQSDIAVNKALEEVFDLPTHEIVMIIETFGSQLLSMNQVNESQMKSFLTIVGEKKELWKLGMQNLSKFSAEQFPSVLAAHIAEFAKKSNQVDELKDLCDNKWASKTMFVGFIKNSLKQE